MFERPNTIMLSGEQIPIKCDLIVLEKIQDKYESIANFEQLIYTFVPKLDEDGNFTKDEEGRIIGSVTTPADLRPLTEALFWMVEEGCEIMRELGEDAPKYSETQIKRMVDMPPYQLSEVVHDEFLRAFERKN